MANNPFTQDYPFAFADAPPFWDGDWAFMDSVDDLERHLVYVTSIAVDPDNAHDIWAGLSIEKGMDPREGIWSYSSQSGQWIHRSQDEAFLGMNTPVIAFNPHVPGQLFFGTSGQGLYFNGITSTSVPPGDSGGGNGEDDDLILSDAALRFVNVSSGETTFRFTMSNPGWVSLEVYDVRGRLVRQLVKDHLGSGEQQFTWSGRDQSGKESASGVYLVRFVSTGVVQTGRLILVR